MLLNYNILASNDNKNQLIIKRISGHY